MHSLFIESGNSVSYQVHYKLLMTKFNLRFGIPHTDTCSLRDQNDVTSMLLHYIKNFNINQRDCFVQLITNLL